MSTVSRSHKRCQRWLMLLCMMVLLLLTVPSLTLAEEEDAVDLDEPTETVTETVKEEAPAAEEPAAVEEKEEVVEEPAKVEEPVVEEPPVKEEEPAPTPVVEEEPEEVADTKTESSQPTTSKSDEPKLVEKVVKKSKNFVDRVKNINKKDAKKIAVGVLGIWGVSVGVGWIAQNAK